MLFRFQVVSCLVLSHIILPMQFSTVKPNKKELKSPNQNMQNSKDIMDIFNTNVIQFVESCKAREFFNRIKLRGCRQKLVPNRFCYGICNSIYTPDHHVTCKACLPEGLVRRRVSLKCMVRGRLKRIIKEYYYVTSCKCLNMTCYRKRPEINEIKEDKNISSFSSF